MALIQCPECETEISDKAKCCPNCGYKKPGSWAIPIGLCILSLLYLIYSLYGPHSPEAQARAHARLAIELCKKDQADELIPIGTRRWLSEECDSLENDFRKKWGVNP